MAEWSYSPYYSNKELEEINCLVDYYCTMKQHYRNRFIRAGEAPDVAALLCKSNITETRDMINRKLLWSRAND